MDLLFAATVLLLRGFGVIWDGVRYKTIFGKVILPALGIVFCALAFLIFAAGGD